MLARWFNREGIGQILAPDENAAKHPVPEESQSSIWQFLAPDPNFAPPPAPPAQAFASNSVLKGEKSVICSHCGNWTSIESPQKSVFATPHAKGAATPFHTPGSESLIQNNVENLVVSACKDTALSMTSPVPRQKACDAIFRVCASKNWDPKLSKRLRTKINNNESLLRARATFLGQLVPDGFTPLMATAYSGQIHATKTLLEIAPDSLIPTILNERDMQGRTAIHIASEQGHVDVVNLLLEAEDGNIPGQTTPSTPSGMRSPAPLDLLGRTPLGRAIMSPNPTARKRQRELESALFSPGDLSVFGVPRPALQRMATDEALELCYGMADMPGMRVAMEDAVCTARFEYDGKPYWLLGVCDGHGDQGNVSDFVAQNAPAVLQGCMGSFEGDWNAIWKETCLQLDLKLKETKLVGGSTGVFALVGKDLIVVANIGDSRAILIQESSKTGLEEQLQNMKVSEPTDETETEKAKESDEKNGPTVLALSEDHKPNLPEEQARIENAGMKVVPITFQEGDKEITIHKVSKSDKDMMAVSRSFGDFEYKSNPNLSPEEQAVVAVPEVRVHTRDAETDQYLVLACDGVWDVFDNPTLKDFVLQQVQARKETSKTVLPDVGDALLHESLNLGSRDNMTVILAALSRASKQFQPAIQGKALDFGSPQR